MEDLLIMKNELRETAAAWLTSYGLGIDKPSRGRGPASSKLLCRLARLSSLLRVADSVVGQEQLDCDPTASGDCDGNEKRMSGRDLVGQTKLPKRDGPKGRDRQRD